MVKSKKADSKILKKHEKTEISEAEDTRSHLFPISITIKSIENVEAKFPSADMYVVVQHGINMIGKSENKYLSDKTYSEINYNVNFYSNILHSKEVDNLITYPIYIMVWQASKKYDEDFLLIQETETDANKEDILSGTEMTFGIKEPPEVVIKVDKKKSKSAKVGKVKKSKSKDSSTTTKVSIGTHSFMQDDPVCIGSGTVDLLPFFNGETEIVETVPIYPKQLFIDDRFKHDSLCPQLSVIISIQEPLFVAIGKTMVNSFQITLESLYNLPEDLNECCDYKIATVHPLDTLELEQFYFDKGVFKAYGDPVGQMKFWPNLTTVDDLGSQTKQIIQTDDVSIKNKTNINLNEALKSDSPKVVWNTMKRSWLSLDANEYLRQLITKYRNWPIEIKISPLASPSKKDISSRSSKERKKVNKKSNDALSVKDGKKSNNSLLTKDYHFMVYADISSLLYPGVTKTRVVCPVREFCQTELTKATGYETSCFSNYKKIIILTEIEKDKENEGGEVKTISKDVPNITKDETKEPKPKKKLKEHLPTSAVDLQCDGHKVVVPKGTCFIIIEAELMVPFFQLRTIEDLTQELFTVIPKRPPQPKTVIPIRLAINMFKNTIFEMTRKLNKEYQNYTEKFDIKGDDVTIPCFIKYMKDNGSYQKCLTTIGHVVTLLVKEKFKYTQEQQSQYMFDNYISMIYVYLINEMNKQINTIMNCSLTSCPAKKNLKFNHLYLCDEAIHLDLPGLAEKYYLQVMKDQHRNPGHWLNLAVFYKGQKFCDRAFECSKEVLALKSDHKFGLLLFGGMLFEREDYILAETTLLALVHHYPDCIEAWAGLYIIYFCKTRYDGCDICLENISKYKPETLDIDVASINSSTGSMDEDQLEEYLQHCEPLGWSTKIAAKTPFFHCAVIFIKLQLFQFAEQCLLFDNVNQTGTHKYYFGVIKYFKNEYKEALKYLKEAQKIHGPDYAVNSMIGHCFFRLEIFDEAKEAYEFIVCAYNRPDDMHMLYINLALIYEKENNLGLARKYLLIVCKLSPTPYSWLLLGIVYYKENSFKEAEACIAESNNLDNRLPESWAYLVLINIKLLRIWEAQQCFSQMMKYDLQDKTLLALVILEMKTANESLN